MASRVTDISWLAVPLEAGTMLPLTGHVEQLAWALLGLTLTAASLMAVLMRRERDRTHNRLREITAICAATEERLRQVLQVSSSGIAAVDVDGVIVMANQVADRLFGYEPGGLRGVLVEDLVPPALRQPHRELRRSHHEAGQMTPARTVRGLRRDGEEVPLRISLLPFDSPSAPLVYLNIEDVTQQHAAEQARERERERFLQLALVTKDIVWEWDLTTDKIWLSSTMREAYQWEAGEFVDRAWMRARIHPEDLPKIAASMSEAMMEKRALWTCEYRFRRADGCYRDVLMRASIVRDERDELLRVTGIMLDLTERIAMERALRERTAELERSNNDLERFAQVASHDLQEPLRTITSFMQLVTKRYGAALDDDGRRYIAFAVDGAQRMRALISALLSYARLDRREGPPVDRVELDQVMTQVRADLRSALTESGATLTVDPLPAVRGNEPQLMQLMQNLVSNALKYRRDEPPRIHVGARRVSGGGWQISVADNGIGIEDRYFDRIFAVFQRLHTRDAYEGTGIGLAICKRIVERHGGRIWLDSTVGQGSTFHVVLPGAAEGDPGERVT